MYQSKRNDFLTWEMETPVERVNPHELFHKYLSTSLEVLEKLPRLCAYQKKSVFPLVSYKNPAFCKSTRCCSISFLKYGQTSENHAHLLNLKVGIISAVVPAKLGCEQLTQSQEVINIHWRECFLWHPAFFFNTTGDGPDRSSPLQFNFFSPFHSPQAVLKTF